MVLGSNLLVGTGGYISAYKKPLFSNRSTLVTIRRQIQMINWYSRFSLDIYVLQDQLISKHDAKKGKDLEVVMKNKDGYAQIGKVLRKFHLDSCVHTSHYVSPSTPNESVREKTKIEIMRDALICLYSGRAIRHVTTHLGWCHKNCIFQEDAIHNAICFFQELKLGNLICIENDDLESKLGNSQNVLRVCEEVGALPLFDIAHYKLLEGKNWFETFLRFADFWKQNEPIIFHYSTTDRIGIHLALEPKDFKECTEKLLTVDNKIAIVLEAPQNTRINDAIKAKHIIMSLPGKKNNNK